MKNCIQKNMFMVSLTLKKKLNMVMEKGFKSTKTTNSIQKHKFQTSKQNVIMQKYIRKLHSRNIKLFNDN